MRLPIRPRCRQFWPRLGSYAEEGWHPQRSQSGCRTQHACTIRCNFLKIFFGFGSVLRQVLLPSYATEAESLHRLTKKNVEWNWGSHEQSSFERLKSLLSSDAVLTHYNPALPNRDRMWRIESWNRRNTLFIAILIGLRDRSPMFPRFCPSPRGITVRSRKRLWQLRLLSRSFSSICLVKSLSWLLATSLYSPSMAIRSH